MIDEILNAREQFVSDYVLIAENDFTAYTLIHKMLNNGGGVADVREATEQHFDSLTERLFDLMDGKEFSEFERMLIRQILGFGSDDFNAVARELVARHEN